MVGVTPYRIQLRDLDAFRHLSHVRLLELLEIGRIDLYLRLVGASKLEEIDLIMAELRIRYHAPAVFGEQLAVGTTVGGLGRSSIAFDYEVWKPTGVTIATGRTTCVCFDYKTEQPQPLDPAVRQHPGIATLTHPSELDGLPKPGEIRLLSEVKQAASCTGGDPA